MLNTSVLLALTLSLLLSLLVLVGLGAAEGDGVVGLVTPCPHLQLQESNVPVELEEARWFVTRAAKAVVAIVKISVKVVKARERIVVRRDLLLCSSVSTPSSASSLCLRICVCRAVGET